MTDEAERFVKARTLRERADTLLRESVEAGNADCWGDTIRHAMIDAAMVLYTEATQLEGRPLEPHDVERWAAFLPTVSVGGALPVTFRVDGHFLVVEVIVPYEPPEPQEPELQLFVDTAVPGKTKIPLAIAKGFPVPVSARYKLPPYHEESAERFVRHLVRQLYLHEVDEQLRVGDRRPFAPKHYDAP
jgi:hypothetical protein